MERFVINERCWQVGFRYSTSTEQEAANLEANVLLFCAIDAFGTTNKAGAVNRPGWCRQERESRKVKGGLCRGKERKPQSRCWLCRGKEDEP
ncbi:hypothetical protein chiPu_0010510 [Chiloscyllium punctatum]|uniref:Uncharacterized protein n=1 Tax=Chiloscyllium punctatum TaxID=137246 RepID=A0A401SNT4_CHIPU|nr:hypothetical protein [Chiloscyllium punctatum]